MPVVSSTTPVSGEPPKNAPLTPSDPAPEPAPVDDSDPIVYPKCYPDDRYVSIDLPKTPSKGCGCPKCLAEKALLADKEIKES
jgi:hypothetical protein